MSRRGRRGGERGVAMVIVMWIILVLSLMIGGFAFTMHVETQVASFNRKQLKAEMLARSGVELARMQLILDTASATEGAFDALNQQWATNELLYVNHELGDGIINVTVTDEEGKMPINQAAPEQLKRLLDLLAVDPADADAIADSVQDWIDDNDTHRLNGAEDEYYLSLVPPYRAKNAPLDRVEELLLVRGMTPEILYGQPAQHEDEEAIPGLLQFITTTSAGQVNVNTATREVLQAFLGLDDIQADAVVNRRDGGDGITGTEDDQPFQSVDEFTALLGNVEQGARERMRQALTVKSSFFRIQSTGEVGGVRRKVTVIVQRQGAVVTVVSWQEKRGG